MYALGFTYTAALKYNLAHTASVIWGLSDYNRDILGMFYFKAT